MNAPVRIAACSLALASFPALALAALPPASAPGTSAHRAAAHGAVRHAPAPSSSAARHAPAPHSGARHAAPATHKPNHDESLAGGPRHGRHDAKPVKGPKKPKGPKVFAVAKGRCRVSVPADWTARDGGMGAPRDRMFSVLLKPVPDYRSSMRQLEALRGHLVADKPKYSITAVRLPGRGDARQFWVVTKGAGACRATITFPDGGHEAEARRIADSLAAGK